MGGKIATISIRFNLDRPEDKKAWEYIHNPDKKESCNRLVITAINAFIKQQYEPNNQLIQQITKVIEQSLDKKLPQYLMQAPSPIENIPESDNDLEDVDFDFIGG